ncbi:hypothetical protein PM082_010072 [Marasmius tenuissimus]|nr:hypothetical protein PM082_010072 [Marasmius tenuissimus]
MKFLHSPSGIGHRIIADLSSPEASFKIKDRANLGQKHPSSFSFDLLAVEEHVPRQRREHILEIRASQFSRPSELKLAGKIPLMLACRFGFLEIRTMLRFVVSNFG